jgi:hypothetical protein
VKKKKKKEPHIPLDLHLDHFEGAANDTTQNIAIMQTLAIIGQLDKVNERILLQHQRKLFFLLFCVGERFCQSAQAMETRNIFFNVLTAS